MAFIATPLTARVAIRYSLFGNDVVNTLWFQRVASTDDFDVCQSLASVVDVWAQSEVIGFMTEDITLEDVTATSQESSTAASAVIVDGVTVGGVGNPGLPSSNCITMKFITGARGRSGRGRNYIGGLYETGVVGDTVGNTFIDGMLDSYNALASYVGPLDWTHVVVSKQLDGVVRAEGLAQIVTGYQVVDALIDGQRKRLTGRGS